MISTIAPLAVLLSVARAQNPEELFEECTANQVAGVDLGGRSFGYADIGGSITEIEMTSSDLGINFIFFDTAVSTDGVCAGTLDDPDTNCLYVLYQDSAGDDGAYYIGIIDRDELPGSTEIAGDVQLDADVESIAFDCDGTMYGTLVGSSEVVTINLATGATTTFSSGGAQCAGGSECFNTLVYNSEEQQLYRFSSSAEPESLWVCTVPEEDCSMVSDPDNLCVGDGRIAISATDLGDEGVGLTCSNGAGSDVYVAVDLDDFTVSDTDVPGLAGANAFSAAYYNTESEAYCACDFDGENEINGGDDDDDDDDDDSSSISSESSESSESSDSSSGSDAKAFFAQLDTAVENDDGNDELTQESADQVSYTYELSLSDSSLQVAWVMFAMCMLVNLSVAFCVWRKKRTEVIV